MKTNPINKNDVNALMRSYGIMPTHQRAVIAQLLFAHPQHLSAEQVLILANRHEHRVSKATVYNTLGLFARKGLLREVIIDPNKVFYDSTSVPHHHFYNVDSGQLMDIDAKEVTLGTLPNLPEGTIADGVDVIIRVRNQTATE
jgi:Fur family transcriptional regulator, iron response regulator